MAEVANRIYRKLIEAGIPAKIKGEYHIHDVDPYFLKEIEKSTKEQGVKKVEQVEDSEYTFIAEFEKSEVKDVVKIPSDLLCAWIKIGRRMIWVNPSGKEYDGIVAKKYQSKVKKIMEDEKLEDVNV